MRACVSVRACECDFESRTEGEMAVSRLKRVWSQWQPSIVYHDRRHRGETPICRMITVTIINLRRTVQQSIILSYAISFHLGSVSLSLTRSFRQRPTSSHSWRSLGSRLRNGNALRFGETIYLYANEFLAFRLLHIVACKGGGVTRACVYRVTQMFSS